MLVPTKLRDKVMEELHSSHPGVVRMKALARSHVWWLIEHKAASCTAGQATRNALAKSPRQLWTSTTVPWEHIHEDFTGQDVFSGDRRAL